MAVKTKRENISGSGSSIVAVAAAAVVILRSKVSVDNDDSRLTAIFQHNSDFIGAKDEGGGDDNWSCKTKACNAPVKSSPPTKQHPTLIET